MSTKKKLKKAVGKITVEKPILPLLIQAQIMKDRLRNEIVDQAKHVDDLDQEIRAKKAKMLEELEGDIETRNIAENKLNKLKAAGRELGIVFERPARYEQYLH